ncbi:MAG: glycogen-binding domain-containing protein [Treponema sp.]|jgi:hypothetical protein|nr:glycogen-binding domain-containing protein [Treponema sp.]
MKTITAAVLLILNIGFLRAADTESYEFIDRLLSLTGPGAPEVYEDAVIFTASAANRRVGIAFAHEGFSRVHWFRKLLVPQDPGEGLIPKDKRVPDPYRDSGILFHVQQVPENMQELEYRLIIDGLWTADPANPRRRIDAVSALANSVVSLPVVKKNPGPLSGPPGALSFAFKGPPGETVTVGGSFNGWDPYMYELKENPPGYYTLTLPLPPGRYQYVFFHRGERRLDPYNFNRVYTKEGKTASEIVIQ